MRILKTLAAVGWVSLLALPALPAFAEEWPQWRGPRDDGIVRGEKLADSWPAAGPKKLWETEVGVGFSSPVAAGGKVYLFTLDGDKDTLYAFDAEKGTPLWKQQADSLYTGEMQGAAMAKDWTGTRASPVIEAGGGDGQREAAGGGRIYTYGFRGDLICRELATGKLVWHVNVVTDTKTQPITWGQGSNPLIDGDVIYVQGGVNGPTVVAINKKSGKLLWQSENLPADPALAGNDREEHGRGEVDKGGYARPILADIGGTRQLVVFGGEALWGFDPKTGKTLWKHPWPTEYDVNAATPIYHEGRLFITSAYSRPPARCAQFELSAAGAKQVWTNNQLTAKYQPPILAAGHLYGNSEGAVRCLRWEDGKTVWTAKDRINQGGSLLRIAPDKLLMFSDTGKAILARATPEAYEKLAEAQVVARTGNAWSTPLVYRGKMYVKGRTDFACYDVGAK